jgi:hypothetical protein
MHKQIYLLLTCFIFTNFLFANVEPFWGATGHRTVGVIAQEHLTKKAQKQIEKILHGESLALVSTFGDDIKSDPKYKKLSPWHYVNFPFDTKYEDSEISKDGDIITGINYCIRVLKDKNSSKEDQTFYLKFLVHLIGDLHQPMHVGRAEDKGGNDFQVRWFNKGTNLHRVWDSDMIESFNMSYSELAANEKQLSDQQIKAIQKGTVLDWTYETQDLAKKVYTSAEIGEKLSYKYSYDNFDTVRNQLQKAGLRLAQILNEIYG